MSRFFLNAPRRVSDYLKEYRAGFISLSGLKCAELAHQEASEESMTLRCRHEVAYHTVGFLIENLLQLVHRRKDALEGDKLVDSFLSVFPLDGPDVRKLYGELAAKKQTLDFAWPVPDLDRRLELFVRNFEVQFRRMFFSEATRHVVFRHAPTALDAGAGGNRRLVGRSNPEVAPIKRDALDPILESICNDGIAAVYISPQLRCRQTYEALAGRMPLPEPIVDPRLVEIDYGQCEGQSVHIAQQMQPELFAAWQRGEDRAFPDGESTADVAARAIAFANDCWPSAAGNTVTCTHNAVMRTLVGHAVQVPPPLWHRLMIPHLQPFTFVQTRSHGWFIDLDESAERQIFAEFSAEPLARRAA